jgi:hypothetical protein
MPDRIEPIRGDDGVRAVPQVERQRLLTPAEREEARRKREEARRKIAKRTDEQTMKNSSQGHHGGADYLA